MTPQDILNAVEDHIERWKRNNHLTDRHFYVRNLRLVGSREIGNHHPDSDIDVVVEFSGSLHEDDATNALDGDDPLYLGDTKVDMIFLKGHGALKAFLKRQEDYRKLKEETVRPEMFAHKKPYESAHQRVDGLLEYPPSRIAQERFLKNFPQHFGIAEELIKPDQTRLYYLKRPAMQIGRDDTRILPAKTIQDHNDAYCVVETPNYIVAHEYWYPECIGAFLARQGRISLSPNERDAIMVRRSKELAKAAGLEFVSYAFFPDEDWATDEWEEDGTGRSIVVFRKTPRYRHEKS